MKHNKHSEENTSLDTSTEVPANSSTVELTDADRENGNLKKFSISKKLIKKLKARNIDCLYPVQVATYSTIHEQKDCCIEASSGSGKTLAFSIPIVQLLQYDNPVELSEGRTPRALVLTSARDTAKTISNELETIANELAIVSIFKSKKKTDDQDTAIANGCDILIATPNRLKEMLDESKVDLSQVKHVVLDDTDKMLDDDTAENLKEILQNVLPSKTDSKGQLIVFCEKMSDSIRKLTKKHLSKNFSNIDLTKQDKSKGQKKEENSDDEDLGQNGEQKTEQDNDQEKAGEDEDEPFVPKSKAAKQTSEFSDGKQRSLLTKQENYTTYMLAVQDELRGIGLVFSVIRRCLGEEFDARRTCSKIALTKDKKAAVFDFPSEYDEQLQGYWKDTPRMQMYPITELPEIEETPDNNGYGGSRGRGNDRGRGFGRGFGRGGRGGYGDGGDRGGFNRGGRGGDRGGFNRGGRGGGRGGRGDGGRGGWNDGNKRTFNKFDDNGNNDSNETSNKKIKFDDDE